MPDLSESFAGEQTLPVDEKWIIELDYPVLPRSRYGYGKPVHRKLNELLAKGHDQYRATLESLLRYVPDLLRFPVESSHGSEAFWKSSWLPGLDIVALYGFISEWRPSLYLEIGSGYSTRFVRAAIEDHDLPTKIVSVDPSPRDRVDLLCDEVYRQRMEDIDLDVFSRLKAGDILFLDGSHRTLTNSDSTVFFLDVLPSLPAGVNVQIHDIFLPYDYPPHWHDRWYWDQYTLAVALLNHADWDIILPNAFVAGEPDLARVFDVIWNRPEMYGVDPSGQSFWFRTR